MLRGSASDLCGCSERNRAGFSRPSRRGRFVRTCARAPLNEAPWSLARSIGTIPARGCSPSLSGFDGRLSIFTISQNCAGFDVLPKGDLLRHGRALSTTHPQRMRIPLVDRFCWVIGFEKARRSRPPHWAQKAESYDMAKINGAKRRERLKVNVTAAEKTEIARRAEPAGQSLSDYLRHVGLARRMGASPEQVLQVTGLLQQVLEMLEQLAAHVEDDAIDAMLVLTQLQRIERVVLMLAPVDCSARFASC